MTRSLKQGTSGTYLATCAPRLTVRSPVETALRARPLSPSCHRPVAVFSLDPVPLPSSEWTPGALGPGRGPNRAGGCSVGGRRESPRSLKYEAGCPLGLDFEEACAWLWASRAHVSPRAHLLRRPRALGDPRSPPRLPAPPLTRRHTPFPSRPLPPRRGRHPVTKLFDVVGNVSRALCETLPHFYPEW